MRLLVIIGSLALCANSWAFDRWQFKTPLDSFTLEKKGAQFELSGRPVSLDEFSQFFPFFQNDISGDCGALPKNADAIVTASLGSKEVRRRFYLALKTISDGSNCVQVDGIGIYYLPLHRAWFRNENGSIPIESSFNLELEGGINLSFLKSKAGLWKSPSGKFFPDGERLSSFIQTLRSFTIDHRLSLQAEALAEKKFALGAGGKRYDFYLIGKNLWAFKTKGVSWLVSSESFSQFLDMDPKMFYSRHSDLLAQLADKNLDYEARSKALRTIHPTWTDEVKSVYYDILTDPAELSLIKVDLIEVVKQKPTTETFRVLARALRKTEDTGILHRLTKALRISQPKLPVIEEDALTSSKEVQKTISEWEEWVKKLQ